MANSGLDQYQELGVNWPLQALEASRAASIGVEVGHTKVVKSAIRPVVSAALLAMLAACTGGRSESSERTLYQGSFTVLESPDHGPELCTSVRESLPPQCSGLPVGGGGVGPQPRALKR